MHQHLNLEFSGWISKKNPKGDAMIAMIFWDFINYCKCPKYGQSADSMGRSYISLPYSPTSKNVYPGTEIIKWKKIDVCVYILWKRKECKSVHKHTVGNSDWQESSCLPKVLMTESHESLWRQKLSAINLLMSKQGFSWLLAAAQAAPKIINLLKVMDWNFLACFY